MFHKAVNHRQTHLKTKVTIKRDVENNTDTVTKMIYQITGTLSNYISGAHNTYTIAMKHDGGRDPNAFHHFLKEEYAKFPKDKVKVLILPILSPSMTQVYQRVVAIGNPVILNELRKIPRTETVSPAYYDEHPESPKIGGGRAFDSVLEAIGMGVLSAEHSIHTAFTHQMISTLTIKSIEGGETWYKDNPFKQRFVSIVKEETNQLMEKIRKAENQNETIQLDFRFFALKIFLRGFYTEATWEDQWIHRLSQTIEEISDAAFRCITNPYANLAQLRESAKTKLDPFIDLIMKENQAFYLSDEYIKKTDAETIRQIIISLLFAGGDNIKKFLDHVLVEFGNDEIRSKYLQKNLSKEDLHVLVMEIGRRYTTIYAQPGKALEDFIIEYEKGDIKEKFFIKAGDELHYTTWEANMDTTEWGETAKEFNPEEHQKHYDTLNPLATFGSGSRICRGKSITLAIIEHFVAKAVEEFTWEARVDGKKNHHPTEFNFNHGIKGEIQYTFIKRQRLMHSPVSERMEESTVQSDIDNASVVPVSLFRFPKSQPTSNVRQNVIEIISVPGLH